MAEISVETPSSNEITRDVKFKQLTEKYGIHQGSEISLKKIKNNPEYNSAVKPGEIITGIIIGEVGLGKSLTLSKEGNFAGNTSGIVNTREKDGRLQFLTQSNSVYDVISKKATTVEEIIRSHFEKQPNTTKDIIENHKDLFITKKKIDNKIWVFTANYGDKVMALVNSDEEPDIFHPRFFRVSGSDHQFKAYPGYRSNMKALKGKEDNENHHYVQSAKLDSRVILALQELPEEHDYKKRNLISDYMPIMADLNKNISGRNLENFKFSEEQVVFKNKDWQKIQKYQKYLLDTYEYLNFFPDKKKVKDFYTSLEAVNQFFKLDTSKLSEAIETIPNKNDKWTMADILSSKDPLIINFKNEISQVAQNLTEAIFTFEPLYKYMKDTGFIPNFKQEPIKKYIKIDGQNKIKIEIFQNSSPDGDILCWEMATDNKGRTYIDNIYDPTVGIDSYGTPKKKTNMGMLIYKPEDYDTQVTFVPKKYTKDLDNDYVDISRLIELSEPVKMYKERLKS